jgi:hypothetical protein
MAESPVLNPHMKLRRAKRVFDGKQNKNMKTIYEICTVKNDFINMYILIFKIIF